jgi:hypothetical protein
VARPSLLCAADANYAADPCPNPGAIGGVLCRCGLDVRREADPLYGRLFEGQVRQYEPNPDGNNIAEYRQYGGATSIKA